MQTSAMALSFLMDAAQSHPNGEDNFLVVVSNFLGFEEEDSKIQTIKVLWDLISRIEQDIEVADLDEKKKARAIKELKAFDGIKNLSQINQQLQHAKSNFLTPVNLLGLSNINLALYGKATVIVDLPREVRQTSEELRQIRGQILETSLPKSVKFIIARRLDQISSILENYAAFGPNELQSEIEGLVGSLVLHSQNAKAEDKRILQKLGKVTLLCLAILKGTDLGVGYIVNIEQNVEKIVDWSKTDDK